MFGLGNSIIKIDWIACYCNLHGLFPASLIQSVFKMLDMLFWGVRNRLMFLLQEQCSQAVDDLSRRLITTVYGGREKSGLLLV